MMRTTSPQSAQRGMTTLGLIILLCFLGIFVYGAMRLIPVFMEDQKIGSALRKIQQEYEGGGADKRLIRGKLATRFDVESVSVISYRDVDIRRTGDTWTVTANYTNKTPFLGPVSFAVDFYHQVEVNR